MRTSIIDYNRNVSYIILVILSGDFLEQGHAEFEPGTARGKIT